MKKFRKNNKGFTLVELIIVVAIIAVLSAVLVPQYIQYVEKSRIGVDESYISEVAHNIEIIGATDPKVNNKTVTVKFAADGAIKDAGDTDEANAVDAELTALFPAGKQKFVSNYYKGLAADTVKIQLKSNAVAIAGTKNINVGTVS